MEDVRDNFSKGQEAFKGGDVSSAIKFYSEALSHDPLNPPILLARAHAYSKDDSSEGQPDFEKAASDASRALSVINEASGERWSDLKGSACMRLGTVYFNLGRYGEAKKVFSEGLKCEEDRSFNQWLIWCDEKMARLASQKEGPESGRSESRLPEAGGDVPHPAPAKPQKIKYDWYQTETQVVVEVRVKGLKPADVKVEFGDACLSVSAQLPSGNEYSLELDLCHPIVPARSCFKVLTSKLEVKMQKKEGTRWTTLEGDGTDPLSAPKPTGYPSSKGSKDWDKIAVDIEQELSQDKAEGEAALNEMFQKIYSDADDNTKRAMNKSFQESGGTVLSTNWGEIGSKATEIKPPEGMEYRRWDQ